MAQTLLSIRPSQQIQTQMQRKETGEKKPTAVVVGAGAFGGWAARDLQRAGFQVTVLDAWGPANSRASSGDETRVIRAAYGEDPESVKNTARAMKLWRGLSEESGERVFHENGVLWMMHDDESYVRSAMPAMTREGLEVESIDRDDAEKRWPQVNFDGITKVFLEREAGFLLARRACYLVVRLLRERGGKYLQAAATPGEIKGGKMKSVTLHDGTELKADCFVFACGPWMPKLFPEVIGDLVRPTRQEVFYFGVPPGRGELTTSMLPIWIDFDHKLSIYGIPSGGHHGFKVADDQRGPLFDPSDGERTVTPESVEAMREKLSKRFPGIEKAPLLETRVCQYEDTPDRRFILDRHPEAKNVILLAGGSGHGFKQSPVMGEFAAAVASGRIDPPAGYRLSRF